MKLRIIAVGRLKESYLKAGVEEYRKRMTSMIPVEIVEVPDESLLDKSSEKDIQAVKDKEGEKLLAHLSKGDKVIALTLDGRLWTSEDLAESIRLDLVYGLQSLVFLIGGSHGLSEAVVKRADLSLSFGRMTLPHQLMRLVLVEQIYRLQMINQGSTYHK